jgi:hypothetical protein
LDSAVALRPDLGFISERRARCRSARLRTRELTEQLHRSMLLDDWNKALALADELLELAPEYSLASDARRRAWKMVDSRRAAAAAKLGETRLWQPTLDEEPIAAGKTPSAFGKTSGAPASTMVAPDEDSSQQQFEVSQAGEPPPREKFLLWVDGVGGYLVCLDDEIVIGQASPENAVGPNRVDLAIRGDISRRHAVIHRRGESYTIEPLGVVQVNGRRIRDCTLIADGAEIVLGDNVRLRFRQPHPLSASARLEFVSRHRSHPYSDAVLLMAESCVLGAGERNHAVCHDWKQDVVLYREGEELCCRTMQQIQIDGRLCDGRARLGWDSRIVGDHFSVTLEEV